MDDRPESSNRSRTRPPSIRGHGIRFILAILLPATGLALVIWTVVELILYQTHQA